MNSCNKPIQVFEYTTLQVQEDSCFQRRHWQLLGWYNETHGGKYFDLTPNGVRFKQFVGVIQAGDLVIEVLPKVGKQAAQGQEAVWSKVLLDMLAECHWMQVEANEKAFLKHRYNSILEAYLEVYVMACEQLLRQGLIKRYRLQDVNCKALKGKLLFGKNIQYNLVHQENFYTRHQVYDQNHLLNQILLKALRLVSTLSKSPLLRDRVQSLLLNFPELNDIHVNAQTFEKLHYNRKTASYRDAIEIAAMLLLNYRPDISGGSNHVLAILFDMNQLWEEYIFRALFKKKKQGWFIQPQNQKRFWFADNSRSFKLVRPDISVTIDKKVYMIIDTKWKLPDYNNPADNDLKQMFVYNEFWDSKSAILLYPSAEFSENISFDSGYFKNGDKELHRCGMLRVSVLAENQKLDRQLGERLVTFIEDEIERCAKVYSIKS
ncbi:McrC family protein [Mongoliitalea lutea]|uniref:McrC family protein n=1 Tax=Mongoliitalea lutea TaxID=849756 RepID=UPI001675F38C|nr:restriction endonuclease [Mongoliitalea lutea]